MIVEKLMEKLPIRSNFMKLIISSILVALLISLGTIGVLKLFGFSVNPVLPATLGVIGAAVYAASANKKRREPPDK